MILRTRCLLVALVLALSAPTVFGQGDVASDTSPDRLFILMQGFRSPNLHGGSLSSAFGVPLTGVGAANPAALSGTDRVAFGISYQAETTIDEGYVSGIGYGPQNGMRPQEAAVAVPAGGWTFGASYAQRYVANLDFGSIPVTTSDNPDIDPIVFEAEQAARLETVAPLLAYRQTLASGGDLAVGFRLGLGYMQFDSVIDETEETISDWGVNAAAGVTYRQPGAFGLAAYFESPLRVEGEVERDLQAPCETCGTVGSVRVAYADALPARFGASILLEPTDAVALGVDFARVFWESAWDGFGKNNTEAAAWARFDVTQRSWASLGVLTQGRDRWDNGFPQAFGYGGRAVYLTAGGQLHLGRFVLDAVVADSRLFSDSEQRQTVVKVGASVGL